MSYERVVALNVKDEASYLKYRESMTPLLLSVGGQFRHDFHVDDVLKSECAHPVNRVFVIVFPDRDTHQRFFADERYLAIRREHFDAAVHGATTIAAYEGS